MKNIGFVGLGNMGKGMSINLSRKDDLKLIGFDINPDCGIALQNEKIEIVDDLKYLIENVDIVITMLPDGKAVKIVWDELIKFAKPNQFLIDCSTIDVKTSISVQTEAMKKGLFTLDAPVSGGVIGADNATLTFMIGGKEEVFKKTNFLFNIMGKNSILCGDNGAGQSAKICNNMLLATTMIAVGESFNLGKNLNLDLNKLFEVLSTSTGSCWAINNYCPIKGVGPLSPSDHNYEGGFSSELMFKDLGLAMEAIKETNTSVLLANETHKKYKSIIEKGIGKLDFSNVINY